MIAKRRLSGFTYQQRQMFEQMLYVDTLRGADSTGAYVVNKYGNVDWCKEASTPETFTIDKDARSILSDISWDGVAAVGHNRKATKGIINDTNAHPFIEGNIILVHNGTLLNHKDLNNEVEVDSHAIAHAISDHGITEAISKIEGAFAVAAYDVENRKIHLFRNKERPLWIQENDDAYFFASEPWMIWGIGWRNNIKFTEKTLREIEPSKLYSFDLSEDVISLSEQEVKLYEAPKTPPVIYTFPKPGEKKERKKVRSVKKLEDYLEQFKKGDVVVFKPTAIEINKAAGREFRNLKGVHYLFEDVSVNCVLHPTDTRPLSEFMGMGLLTTEISAVGYNSTNGNKMLYCSDVMEANAFETINGTTLNDEEVNRLDGICTTCGCEIDLNELENKFVRMNKTKTIHLCQTCVEDRLEHNPNWVGIIKNETSNLTVLH